MLVHKSIEFKINIINTIEIFLNTILVVLVAKEDIDLTNHYLWCQPFLWNLHLNHPRARYKMIGLDLQLAIHSSISISLNSYRIISLNSEGCDLFFKKWFGIFVSGLVSS